MDPNHLTPQFLPSHAESHRLALRKLTYQHPAEYQGASPNYLGYNEQWGPEQEHMLVFIANQVRRMSTAPKHAVMTDIGFQCRWRMGDISCSQGFAEFSDLITHLRGHGVFGEAGRKLVCQWLTDRGICDKELRRDGFKRHIASHVGRSASCPECNKSFSREDTLREHRKKAHERR